MRQLRGDLGMPECKIVSIQHREAMTTSLIVAEVFGKRHDRVLEAIRNFIADLPEGAPFFRETSYTDLSNRVSQCGLFPIMYGFIIDVCSFRCYRCA